MKQGKRACSDAEEAGAELTVWRNRNIVKKICCARLEATTALLLLHPVGHSLCRFSGVWESCCLPASRSSGCICDGPVGSAWACDRWAAVNSPRHFDIAAWFLNCCGKSASGSQAGKVLPTAETWGQSELKEEMNIQQDTPWASQAACHHFLVLLSQSAQSKRGPEQAMRVLHRW